jgi:leishmanolysin
MNKNKSQSTKKQSIVILVISLCLLSMSLSEGIDVMSHTSHHDEFMSDKKVQYVDTRSRLLAAKYEFRNFRIAIDWTMNDAWLTQQPSNDQAALKAKTDYMKNILGTVNNYFSARFQVNSQESITLPATTCHGATVNPKFTGKPIEQDLVITIKPHNESSGWFAAAGACLADSSTGRPVMGAVYLNYQHIRISEVNKYYLPGVFIHELMHVMGFSGGFMDQRGLLKQIKHGSTTRTAVVSDRVVKHAREYFNCPELEGVPVENGGGGGSAGSHWEKTIFPAEVMNPQVSFPMKVSELTIMLLEDLGWYKGVNAHENYTYLKGDGCHTIKGGECNSSKSDEFCSADDWNHDHCYPNKLGKGFCGNSSTFMGKCGLIMPSNNAQCTIENSSNRKNFNFESYGPHSRCVMASSSSNNFNAACLRMRCTVDKVEMQFGDEVHTCAGSGPQTVATKAFSGKVDCPAFSEMCTEVLDKRCPMDCYGNGYCMANGTCQCLAGFTGDDCNHGLPKEQDPFVTDYDIRNKGEKKDDEEEKEEEEEEKEEEEEGDGENDDEEEKEDDDEEEKEEEEEVAPKSSKAVKLEARIARYQTYSDQWLLSSMKHHYRKDTFALCAKGETSWNRRCAKFVSITTKNAEHSDSRYTQWSDKTQTLTTDLTAELTPKQQEIRKISELGHSIERKKALTGKFLLYLTSKKGSTEKSSARWRKYSDHYSELIEMYKGHKSMENFIKRLMGYVERFNMYINYYEAVGKMTETKIAEVQGEGDEFDGFVDVESITMPEMQEEMDNESRAASGSGSGSAVEVVHEMIKN